MISPPKSSEKEALDYIFNSTNYHVSEVKNLLKRSLEEVYKASSDCEEPNRLLKLSGASSTLRQLIELIK